MVHHGRVDEEHSVRQHRHRKRRDQHLSAQPGRVREEKGRVSEGRGLFPPSVTVRSAPVSPLLERHRGGRAYPPLPLPAISLISAAIHRVVSPRPGVCSLRA